MTELWTPGAVGLFDDVPDIVYHAHFDSLSSSGAKLLGNRTPFEFWWAHTHPPVRKREFDLGHAAHRKILGKGAEIEVIDYPTYNTKAAKELRDSAYDAGRIPLLTKQFELVDAMEKRARSHALGEVLFRQGVAERSGWWIDPATGVLCRVRPDWMTWIGDVLYIVDVKTCADADPDVFERAAIRWGYHQQQHWYVEGIRALTGAKRIRFLLFAISTTAPHMITTHYADDEAVAEGERANRRARQIFARCLETGQWPEYPLDPHPISLPRYHAITQEEDAA